MPLILSDGHSESSNTTRSRRRIAASLFSAYSLAEISNYSLFSLPIFIQEIDNKTWYVQVGRGAVPEKSAAVVVPKSTSLLLSIKGQTGSHFEIEVLPTDTVDYLKERVWEKRLGWPPDQQVLYYTERGRAFRLRDGITMAGHGVHGYGVPKRKPQQTMCQLSITYHASCIHVTIKPLTTCHPLCPEPVWTEGPRRDLCAECQKRREQEIGRKRKEKLAEKMAAAGVGDEVDGDVWEEIEL
ncbi:hypothetical protein EPUS_00326 [Endocarpon pusillum Z07020]|uniref:Ubiquitin-like domain-containing protein n=1 Tax=Endocarpon pusillum (strain Z07020 / HMAS-L-300199) TaxID=1263415 RepID=U1HMC8_ENDPU|nr:uncharacterized protein EPUS_00326 [Endocarpon pusillum Z07020]ERF70139.1 hypothetical protein EPUS_00326 [Endocarpon pusillum Z07020]